MTLSDRLRTVGLDAGLDEVGICGAEPFEQARAALEQRREQGLHGGMQFTYRNPARSTEPARVLDGAASLVVGAWRYPSELPARPDGPHGRVARYATEDHYRRLRAALERVAELLRDEGHRAVVVADDNALVDRAAAVRAGIGWYGKSSNVLLAGRGSWYVLGSVVTDAALVAAHAPVEDGCGACTRCLQGCPTGAIVAPGVVDARRCLAWLVQADGPIPAEFREAMGDRVYGCDECQEVCPPTRRSDAAVPVSLGDAGSAAPGTWVALDWMLGAEDDELMARLGRWYVPRRDPRYLRRNALVAYGNTASGDDPSLDAVLEPYLDGDDDLLASHAAWAALRLGREDLLLVPPRDRRAVLVEERRRWPTEPAGDEDGRR